MKMTLESTTKIVQLNGVPARVWEGVTESGIKVHAFITRVVAPEEADLREFEAEFKECRRPSEVIQEYPLRMML